MQSVLVPFAVLLQTLHLSFPSLIAERCMGGGDKVRTVTETGVGGQTELLRREPLVAQVWAGFAVAQLHFASLCVIELLFCISSHRHLGFIPRYHTACFGIAFAIQRNSFA